MSTTRVTDPATIAKLETASRDWPRSPRSAGQIVSSFRGKIGGVCYERDFDASDRSESFYRVTGLTRTQRACWGM